MIRRSKREEPSVPPGQGLPSGLSRCQIRTQLGVWLSLEVLTVPTRLVRRPPDCVQYTVLFPTFIWQLFDDSYSSVNILGLKKLDFFSQIKISLQVIILQ